MEEKIKALIEKYEKLSIVSNERKNEAFRKQQKDIANYFEYSGKETAYSKIISDLKQLLNKE